MNRAETIASILNRVIQDKGEEPRKIREDTRILGGELPVDSRTWPRSSYSSRK